jgi:ADP-ribose pyrophosphatase YjhB (NUDIX family)
VGYNSDDLPLASDFQPLDGEANFGPPLTREVVGGVHIAPHCITIHKDQYVLVDWSQGLPRHDPPGRRAVRFPHGLIRYGETFEQCASRLVRDQEGLEVVSSRVVHVYSYLDDTPHWHMEPLFLTFVTGDGAPPGGATLVRHPVGPTLPEGGRWAGKPPFEETYSKFIADQIGIPGR